MKNKIINGISMLWLIFIFSCSTPKFYKEVDIMQSLIQNDINKSNTSIQTIEVKSDDMNKLVFEELKVKLKETNHILYYSSPDNSLSSKKFWFVVYDIDNGIYYNLENNNTNSKKIHIIEETTFLQDKYTSFIFDNYLKNRCDTLKAKGDVSLSGIRTYEVIYEVDLKKAESKNCYFKNFVIMN
jgi:hypothetical protein